MDLRPVHLTIFGCLFWTLGLFASIYSVCDYWCHHNLSSGVQYYIWYQYNFGWCQILIAVLCLAAAFLTRKVRFGVFLYLMANHAIVFGLLQAPVPSPDDYYFVPNRRIVLSAHIEEGLGLRTSVIREIEINHQIVRSASSIYPNKIAQGKHCLVEAQSNSLEDLNVNGIARYLKNRIFSRLSISREQVTGDCPRCLPVFVQMRKCMVERHEQILGKTNGDLLASIVLGDKVVDLPYFVKNNFRRSGVSHLLAASGFNLSIFVTAMCLVLRLVTRFSFLVSVAGIISVIGFVLLAGTSPSVVRAAIWAILLLVLKLSDRRINLIALLAFSMFLHLVIDPFSILDIGWQLSYAATASILCGVENIALQKEENKLPVLKSIIHWLRSASAVVLMAQAAILPLACLYFKQINALFLVVNLLLDPLVAPLTILGFVSSWVCLLGREMGWCLDILAYYPLEYMLSVTRFFSGLEFSLINIKPPPAWVLIEYTCALIYFVVVKQICKRDLKFACIVFLLSLLLLLLSSICP
ncbi:MAG: ComEC/Rec2 family competence protein [Candidatus Melainabacteria bacterium]|nr:ComEC/Rec2 family competence protein [Candidatus Melainabacteria bacterium]